MHIYLYAYTSCCRITSETSLDEHMPESHAYIATISVRGNDIRSNLDKCNILECICCHMHGF